MDGNEILFRIIAGTLIHPHAGSLEGTPGSCTGIFTPEHVTSWKAVTDAVHAKGGYIFLQLWSLGWVADKRYTKPIYSSGTLPVGPNLDGRETAKEYEIAQTTQDDVDRFLEHYRQACRNANAAGFAGVEIHGANGSLNYSEQRTYDYGGSLENQVNPLEVLLPYVKAIVSTHPNLTFIEAMNTIVAGDDDTPADELVEGDDMVPIESLLHASGTAYISNGGCDGKTCASYAEEIGDLVSYSRWFTL